MDALKKTGKLDHGEIVDEMTYKTQRMAEDKARQEARYLKRFFFFFFFHFFILQTYNLKKLMNL